MNATLAKTAASSIVLALAALGSASSFAANSTARNIDGELRFPVFTSTTTRAQVQADYLQAARAGLIIPSSEGMTLKLPAFASARSVADVHSEAVMAARTQPLGSI